MTDAPIRLLLVDDHRFFRDGVRTLVETLPGLTVVAEASNGDEAVALALQHRPDVVLMDLQMPGLSGVEATRRIVQAEPGVGVLILTMFEDTDSLLATLRAGARGYILKDADEDELIRSIQAVAKGEALFGPAIARRLLDYVGRAVPAAGRAAFPELTEREREVLALLAQGLTNRAVAERMGLSLKTARNHVSNVLSKLQVADRAEAINRARAAGLGRAPGEPPP